MNAERWHRVEELYQAALERAPNERAAFLKEACPDADLRREVESLAGFEAPGNSVLDQPAWERRLAAGERLGPYEILEQIGAGGMGEVWKARDTRLGRTVAIKVCAQRFSARFGREAHAIAALNHPHICTLYDVGPNYLVMEYVEGQPLKGPLPIEKAIEYARQILDGLEAAHRRGIVHRDLKPSNILVSKGGVKLLDFGLAKVQPTPAAEPGETGTMGVTGEQAIVGTPQYMAPEQIERKPVDGRTDIFAFGCVLYELLTGQHAFEGKSVSSIMAAVLASEPAPVSERRPAAPAALDRVVSACLAKDPEERFQSARDVKRALDWVLESVLAARPAAHRVWGRVLWAAVALTILGIAAGALWWRVTRRVERPLVRLNVDLGPNALAGAGMNAAISPDGRRLVFPARGPDGKQQLATRLLDQAQAALLPGTENGRNPFFSPDNQSMGFFADGKLKKISINGGAPVTLCVAFNLGGSWGEDGNIVYSESLVSPLFRIPASGGTRQILTKLGSEDVSHRWPQVLPGGQAVLFTASPTQVGMEYANIEVVSLKTGANKILQREGYFGRYLPSGHLVYVHQGVLFGVGFDADRLEVHGAPTPLIEDVASDSLAGGGQFDFSGAPSGPGTLVYFAGKAPVPGWPILWLDSSGKTETLLAAPAVYSTPRLSPDGRRLAVVVGSKGSDIFVYDWQRDATTRLTFDGHSTMPVWNPDGKHIAFQSSSGGFGISWVRSDGAGEPQRLLQSPNTLYPRSFSPDGRRLAYHEMYNEQGDDLWTLPLDTTDPDHPKPGKPEQFLHAPFDNQFPVFSPDGRWIAYRSFESGGWQIYVRPFPGPGGKWQISSEGGVQTWWSKNGRELFFRARNGWLMVVDYTVNGDSFVAGRPRLWSNRQVQLAEQGMDIAPDGKRFVVFPAPEAAETGKGSVHVTFLQNFFDELRRKVPAGR